MLTALCFQTALARADESVADPSNDARTLFNRGIEAFEQRDFATAVTAFRQAMALRPGWRLYYNIGQCEAALKNYGKALDAFEKYLAKGGDEIDAARQNDVMNEIQILANKVGKIDVTAPEGADIIVDGTVVGTAPLPGNVPLAVGTSHVVKAVIDGVETEHTVKVGFGEVLTVNFLESPDNATATPPSQNKSVSKSTVQDTRVLKNKRLKVAGFVTAGVGAALLISGTITGIAAVGASRDIDADCKNRVCEPDMHETVDKKDALALTTDILIPAGVVATTLGAVFLVIAKKRQKELANVSLMSPRISKGFGTGLEWSF